jgi:hypothetical protein
MTPVTLDSLNFKDVEMNASACASPFPPIEQRPITSLIVACPGTYVKENDPRIHFVDYVEGVTDILAEADKVHDTHVVFPCTQAVVDALRLSPMHGRCFFITGTVEQLTDPAGIPANSGLSSHHLLVANGPDAVNRSLDMIFLATGQ